MAMAAPLREALVRIQDTLGVEPFVPGRAQRQFFMAANDGVTSVLLVRLRQRLNTAAMSLTPLTSGCVSSSSKWPAKCRFRLDSYDRWPSHCNRTV